MTSLILGSASPYRAALLERLNIPFSTAKANIDERGHPALNGLNHRETAQMLAYLKAQTIAKQHPGTWVIGSDQLAVLQHKALGEIELHKPGTADNALAQLKQCQGQRAHFHTAVCLLKYENDTEIRFDMIDITKVTYRTLSDTKLQRYIAIDQPLNCAGSAKAESLGIALTSKIESDDPTALIGLPLIGLCQLLEQAGFEVL